MTVKCELYHDNFQNYKRYNIPKAQLVIADIPYNIGANAYASNPMWYKRKYRKFKEAYKREKRRHGQIGLFDNPDTILEEDKP